MEAAKEGLKVEAEGLRLELGQVREQANGTVAGLTGQLKNATEDKEVLLKEVVELRSRQEAESRELEEAYQRAEVGVGGWGFT